MLVVYDQPALRESYVAAIRALTGYRTVGVGNAEDARSFVEGHTPAAVLLDARLPRSPSAQPSYTDGRDLLRSLHGALPKMPILVTSVVWTPFLLWFSVRNGAAGVLRDDIEFPDIARSILEAIKSNHYRAKDDEQQLAFMDAINVTEQDLKILLMKREGLSHQDIAEMLGISRSTIRSHFQKLAGRLGIEGENEGSIVHRASELGLLQFP